MPQTGKLGSELRKDPAVGWSERFFMLALRLLGHLQDVGEGPSRLSRDARYRNAVVRDFETLIVALLAAGAEFASVTDEGSSLPVDMRRTRIAAALQLGEVLSALEDRWGLADVLSPLRFLRSALQDLLDEKSNPFFGKKGEAWRPKNLDTEHGRYWRYVTGLVIEAKINGKSNRNRTHKAAEEWLSCLVANEMPVADDGADLVRRFKDWVRPLGKDKPYNNILHDLKKSGSWPESASQADVFARRAAKYLVSLDRAWGYAGSTTKHEKPLGSPSDN